MPEANKNENTYGYTHIRLPYLLVGSVRFSPRTCIGRLLQPRYQEICLLLVLLKPALPPLQAHHAVVRVRIDC